MVAELAKSAHPGRVIGTLAGFSVAKSGALRLVKSHQKSDSVCISKASTRSSERKPGYLTFPVVKLRVSVA